jgi:NADP-dependent 3-hydroxy acid dehydrogenase YdfG
VSLRSVVITGASTGIGRATVVKLQVVSREAKMQAAAAALPRRVRPHRGAGRV